jgi:hypothetical protein
VTLANIAILFKGSPPSSIGDIIQYSYPVSPIAEGGEPLNRITILANVTY